MPAQAEKKIPKSVDVLERSLQGSRWAAKCINIGKKSSGGKKKGKAKRKAYYPPPEGWRGYAGSEKAIELQSRCGWSRENRPWPRSRWGD